MTKYLYLILVVTVLFTAWLFPSYAFINGNGCVAGKPPMTWKWQTNCKTNNYTELLK
jgi:hypothetical protein